MEQNFRNYFISDADLMSECSRINRCVARDINDFARYQISPDYLFDFEAATVFFSDFLTKEEMQDEVNIITENKEGIAELILRKISVVRTIVEDIWGKTGRYKTFGFEDINKLEDSDLLLMVKRIVRVSNRFFTDLEMHGLTHEIVNELIDLGQQFFAVINLETAAMEDRDLKSFERSLLCDNLYGVLIYLSEKGKTLYEQNNGAKYNDYLLCIEKFNVSQLPQTA